MILLYPTAGERKAYNKYLQTAQSIIEQHKQENMLDFQVVQLNVFGPIKNFYWFGFQNVVIVDQLYHPHKYFDLFDFTKKQRPRYLVLPTLDEITSYPQYPFGVRNFLLLRKIAEQAPLYS